eukprot:676688-Heterocapsa_arctica.AAC.1
MSETGLQRREASCVVLEYVQLVLLVEHAVEHEDMGEDGDDVELTDRCASEPEGGDAVHEVSHVGGEILLARVEESGSSVGMQNTAEPPRLPLAHRGAVDERDALVTEVAGPLCEPVDHARVSEGRGVKGRGGASDELRLEFGEVEARFVAIAAPGREEKLLVVRSGRETLRETSQATMWETPCLRCSAELAQLIHSERAYF